MDRSGEDWEVNTDKVTVHVCGPNRNHTCDSDGPWLHYLEDGTIKKGNYLSPYDQERCTGGSASCSVCGMSAMNRSLWGGTYPE